MAIKFTLVGTDDGKKKLVLIDEGNGNQEVFDRPAHDIYYKIEKLNLGYIALYDITNEITRPDQLYPHIEIGNAKDPSGVVFNATTFKSWARANLGFKSASGGSGAGWDDQVEFRSDLPITLNTPQIGSIYLVEKPTTILLGAFTTYQSGLYIRDFNNGNLNDWRRLNVKVKFTDTEFRIVKASDQSKQAQFDLNLISANRSLTIQDKDGTIALVGDIIQRVEAVLDSSDPNITRTVAGGRTIWEVTHNLNTNYVVQEVYRISNGRTTRMRVERTGLNTIEISRAGTVADGTYGLKILK